MQKQYIGLLNRALLLKMQVDALLVLNFARTDQQDCRNKWNWVVICTLKSPSLTTSVEHLYMNS